MSLPILDARYAVAIAPGAILDDASATAVAVDTRGADFAVILVTIGATDIAAAAMSLTESATSGGSYTAVSNSAFGTAASPSGATSVAPAADDDGQLFAWTIDVRKLNYPFLKVVFTAGDGTAGTYVSAVAILGKLEQAPRTAAELGLTADTNWLHIS